MQDFLQLRGIRKSYVGVYALKEWTFQSVRVKSIV